MLKVNNLSFSYGRHRVLKDIDFQIKTGELCALFGPNGTGKTTLFKCCLKFLNPDSGTVRINGKDIRRLPPKQMARLVAYVPQAHHCAFSFTAGQIVLMGRTPHLNRFFTPGARDRKLADHAMQVLDISHLADTAFNRLSGGQQQMVLIARAIAQQTGLIFLDEPAAALDFKNQIRLWQTLQHIAEQGTAILACTHDPNHVSWFCHSTVVLDKSQLVAKGAPGQVMTQEMMDRIYGDTCQVKDFNGLKIMVPGTVDSQTTNVVAFPGNRKGIHRK
ncbi:ABC transporter ATP-binding protein [uncultured Desulfobacter sp.]|uniref:ABC transporter ATP-binding protein n=1 Tax=uncultured Desulfobacter sp. TaxID=240139 RepID=UPI0029F5B7D3|nr:ABC transporter ATP-binding protein [uncultured Desulfobacter sp.]